MQKSAIINFLGSNTHNSSAIQHSNHIDKTFFLVIMIELSTMSKNFKKSQSLTDYDYHFNIFCKLCG